jgi:hypothetical protein
MSTARLNLEAQTSLDLIRQLSEIDIAVPLQDDGRTTAHRERYMAARLMSTLAETGLLTYPLRLQHREKPDFGLFMPSASVGIECVEAIHEEWAQIQAIRERDFSDALISLPMFRPGERKFTMKERLEVARGDRAGPPWVGNMAERQWAEAMAHFIARKTEKLRRGDYAEFESNWLLIQDEWPVPLHYEEERIEAARMCSVLAQPYLEGQSFANIFVGNSRSLLQLAPCEPKLHQMRDLWR